MKHLSAQFETELQQLKDRLVLMGGLVESMLGDSDLALQKQDGDLAYQIIARDREIDLLEKQIDESCLQILALRQPTAGDLRLVLAALKICTDLERMGDVTVNIAERVLDLIRLGKYEFPQELFGELFTKSRKSVSLSLDAFVNISTETAGKVLDGDRAIDLLTRQIYDDLMTRMKKAPNFVELGFKLFFIAKHLERISDHATNIAEHIVFVAKGLDIRHSATPGPTPESI